MHKIVIPLKHIILDPENPIDLSMLSQEKAIELIKKSYSFLAPAIHISIADSIACISIDTPRAEKISEALNLFQKGVKEAQKAEYAKAIKHFSKVIEIIPHHVDARRNLAMAHLDQGKVGLAKKLLQECLKIDPESVWTFVLLGNIYAKHERNKEIASFYYEAGLAIHPGDNLLLNNFAALQMESGKVAEAKSLFEKALAADATYPSTYYGLALLHKVTRLPEKAKKLLEELFSHPKSSDIRSEPVYKNSRELYAELCVEMANSDSAKLIDNIFARKGELEETTGHLISIEEDASLEYVSATAQMAWKHGRDEHRVRYRLRSPAMTPHLLAHELEHIVLEHEARKIGRNRMVITTAQTREFAIRSITDHITKVQRQGYPEENISDVMLKLINGLNNQIFNCPIDMVVEYNLYSKYPYLYCSQFVSLRQTHEEALQAFTNQEIKRLTPPTIFRASATLNCAYAIFIDHLYGGLTDYSAAYRNFSNLSTARNLFKLWKERIASFRPGDEYELVDEYARQLKLLSWYEWRPNNVAVSASSIP